MQCPARYGYTVVDGSRGGRAESAYLRFHRAVYITIRWLEDEKQEGRIVDRIGALSGLAAVWETDGPIDHAFEKYYRSAAESMVTRMADVIASETGRYEREEWSVPVGSRSVLITPDRVWIGSDGVVHVQRIRTGGQTKSKLSKPIYALMRRGAQRRYLGKRISVEIFYLATNESVEVVAKNDDKLIAHYGGAIRSIETGDFHAEPDARRCPNCPCYFTCAG
jgi:DNA helicase-2/ATP-dependent DNA helicase PcrA